MDWTVLVPLKARPRAKSRLTLADGPRHDLVAAMAVDVVRCALAVPALSHVLLVTADPDLAAEVLGELDPTPRARVRVLGDEPPGGLNAALEYGAAEAARAFPEDGVVVVPGDLAAATPAELGGVLQLAESHPRATLADTAGTGTALLFAGPGQRLRPQFGPESHAAHVAGGAVDLTSVFAAERGLRNDIDSVADLHRMLPRLGPASRAAVDLAGV